MTPTPVLPLAFRLESAVAAGGRRWGMVQSTRMYVPGWTVWGCLVRTLVRARSNPPGNAVYEEIQKLVNQQLWISHFWYAVKGKEGVLVLLPQLDEASGQITTQWRPWPATHGQPVLPGETALTGQTSTALAPTKAAEGGSLHIREAIQPTLNLEGCRLPVHLIGCIHWRSGPAVDNLEPQQIEELLCRSSELTLGRSSGVGQGSVRCNPEFLEGFDIDFSRLPCHILVTAQDDLSMTSFQGGWEPIVLRRWRQDATAGGPGRRLEYFGMALVPGSRVNGCPESLPLASLHGCRQVLVGERLEEKPGCI